MANFQKAEHTRWKKQGISNSILLDLNSGCYYTLNRTATDAWELLTSGVCLDEAVKKISQAYNEDLEIVKKDVSAFLDQLIQDELISESESENSVDSFEIQSGDSYIQPVIEMHEAIQEITAGSDEYDGGYSYSNHYWYPN